MTPIETALAEIKERLERATPGPWGPYNANLPFYVEVTKPAPSLSKHDNERPTYWLVEDAVLVAHAPTDLARLIAALELAIEQRESWRMTSEVDSTREADDAELLAKLEGR